MSKLVVFMILGCLLTGASCLIEFINPPPFGRTGDFSDNPTYPTGSTVNIAWTNGEQGQGVSIVLYQLNETDGQWFGGMEYLTQGAVGVTRYSWLVGTRKNLSISSLFYLSIFQEGKTLSDSNSHYFNIEAQNAAVPSVSSTSKSTSETLSAASSITSGAFPTTSFSVNLSTSTKLPSSPSTSELASVPGSVMQSGSSVNSSNGFPTTAKIGIGVGIPAALVIGIGAGFFLFRQRKKRNKMAGAMTSELHGGYQHHGKATSKPPVELGYHGDPFNAHHNHQTKKAVNSHDETVRHEM